MIDYGINRMHYKRRGAGHGRLEQFRRIMQNERLTDSHSFITLKMLMCLTIRLSFIFTVTIILFHKMFFFLKIVG